MTIWDASPLRERLMRRHVHKSPAQQRMRNKTRNKAHAKKSGEQTPAASNPKIFPDQSSLSAFLSLARRFCSFALNSASQPPFLTITQSR
jgi:hypothetical protein